MRVIRIVGFISSKKLLYPRFDGPQRVEHGETRAALSSVALWAARAQAGEPCGIAQR